MPTQSQKRQVRVKDNGVRTPLLQTEKPTEHICKMGILKSREGSLVVRTINYTVSNSPEPERVLGSRAREVDNSTMFNKSYNDRKVANPERALQLWRLSYFKEKTPGFQLVRLVTEYQVTRMENNEKRGILTPKHQRCTAITQMRSCVYFTTEFKNIIKYKYTLKQHVWWWGGENVKLKIKC